MGVVSLMSVVMPRVFFESKTELFHSLKLIKRV